MSNKEESLFLLAKEFYKKALWEDLSSSQLIAMQFSFLQAPVFVSVVGKEEQERGVLIYRSIEELASFFETYRWSTGRNELSPFQLLASHSCIALMFMDRGELSSKEYNRIKSSGVPFRGRKAWPVTSEFTPGYVPGTISIRDQHLIKEVLRYLIEEEHFKEKAATYKEKLNDFQLPYKIYHEDGTKDELVYNLPIEMVTGNITDQDDAQPILLSPFEIEKAKRLPMGSELWELDIQYINQPLEVKEGARPVFPSLLLLGQPFRQEVLETEVLFRQNILEIQRSLVKNMFGENIRPPQIAIEGRQAAVFIPILKELLKELQIDCLLVEVLPFLTVVKDNLRQKIDGEEKE